MSSKEVSFLANVVSRDCQSVTARNIRLVDKAAGLSPWDYSTARIKAGLEKLPVPENNDWRFPLLLKMLEYRRSEENKLHNTDNLTQMIDSLCAS